MPGCGCGGSTPKAVTGQRQAGSTAERPVGPASPDYFWNGPQRRETPKAPRAKKS